MELEDASYEDMTDRSDRDNTKPVGDQSSARSQLDSLDLLLLDQPEGAIPNSPDLLSLDPSMSMDLMSLPVPTETSDQNSGVGVDMTNFLIPLGNDDLENVEMKGESAREQDVMEIPDVKPCNSSLNSLDFLLFDQPEGSVPESDDLQSLAMPSMNTDLLSFEFSSIKDKDGKGSNDKYVGINENANGKARLDSLDLLLDLQPDGTVPENDGLQSLMQPSKYSVDPFQTGVISSTKKTEENIVLQSQSVKPVDKETRDVDFMQNKAQQDKNVSVLDDKPEITISDRNIHHPHDVKTPGQVSMSVKKDDIEKSTAESKTRLDSLDLLLDNQPEGIVPTSGNLLSDDKFSPHTEHVESKDIEKVQTKTRLDSLDLLLDIQPEGTIPDSDSLQSLMMPLNSVGVTAQQAPVKDKVNESTIVPDDSFQSDSMINMKNDNTAIDFESMQNKSSQGSNKQQGQLDIAKNNKNTIVLKTDDQLDNLSDKLDTTETQTDTKSDEQFHPPPLGIIDDMTSVTSKTADLRSMPVQKDSPTERCSPVEDIFDTTDDRTADVENNEEIDSKVKVTSSKGQQGKARIKKRMERSFEDLLHGLSDESEPELDEMILSDDNDNTNLESILTSPDQLKAQKTNKHLDDFSTPARQPNINDKMDIFTSTPNTDSVKDSAPDLSTPEVKIYTPDDDEDAEIDVKSWEMIDKEEEEEEEMEKEGYKEDGQADDADDDISGIAARNRNRLTSDSADDQEIDLGAIEDTNHLDVDINKHKSALGKKGSMALRRKQSRKSRRSVMATGEDAIFQDSTAPKSTEMMNGDDDYDDDNDAENFDMSPPAKKPSPSMMVPLPGMSTGPPPSKRLSASTPDDEEDVPKPVKRVSKPPPGAFKLPDVMPRLSSKPPPTVENSKKDSSSHTFEKPALRSAKPTTPKDFDKDTEMVFDTPVLRSVQGKGREKESGSGGEDRDVRFEKPALRSTPKPRDKTPDTKMETQSGTFAKPSLKETPKRPLIDSKKEPTDTPSETVITRNLRSTNKPNIGQKPSTENHTFDKPSLRSTGRVESKDKSNEQDGNESSKTFEKPVLRSAKRESPEQSTEGSESVSHTFEKPVLKSTGMRGTEGKKDIGIVGQFDKPSLRKTPSPEKEVKPPHEPKGVFDKPSLRKTGNSSSSTDTSGVKTDYKASFPEMKLRKTTSPQKEVVREKPSWLKDAADKQTKVRDVLQTKENTNNSTNKDVPSWLDKAPSSKGSRGQPLQDTSNGQTETTEGRKSSFTSRSREPSISSENDQENRKTSSAEQKTPQNNYVPSWMRQGRSPSVGSSGLVLPSNSMPNLADSDEVPQWKKELAQRRASRKEQSPVIDTPKREDSSEPEWKKNIQLRKTRTTDTPAKDKQPVEPEWKKAAEEKKARLRSKSLQYSHLQLA